MINVAINGFGILGDVIQSKIPSLENEIIEMMKKEKLTKKK